MPSLHQLIGNSHPLTVLCQPSSENNRGKRKRRVLIKGNWANIDPAMLGAVLGLETESMALWWGDARFKRAVHADL